MFVCVCVCVSPQFAGNSIKGHCKYALKNRNVRWKEGVKCFSLSLFSWERDAGEVG